MRLARPRRRGLRALSTVLIVAGFLILADAAITIVWQEPLTSFTTGRAQAGLKQDLAALQRRPPSSAEADALGDLAAEPSRIAFLARSLRQHARSGEAVARIRIPRIDVDRVVVQGTDPAALRKGPGLYDSTPFPGVPGTTAIAGHRTTYGAPFRRIDELRRGDRIIVELPYGTFTYTMERRRIVKPTEVSVLDTVGYDRLVLSACHPLFSAEKRIVVFARLTGAVGRGSGRGRKLAGPTLSDRVQRPSSALKRTATDRR